jgi:hypothetical protein
MPRHVRPSISRCGPQYIGMGLVGPVDVIHLIQHMYQLFGMDDRYLIQGGVH